MPDKVMFTNERVAAEVEFIHLVYPLMKALSDYKWWWQLYRFAMDIEDRYGIYVYEIFTGSKPWGSRVKYEGTPTRPLIEGWDSDSQIQQYVLLSEGPPHWLRNNVPPRPKVAIQTIDISKETLEIIDQLSANLQTLEKLVKGHR